MKKTISLFAALFIVLALLAGCSSGNSSSSSEAVSEKVSEAVSEAESASSAADSSETVEKIDISIAGLKGPTSMGLVKVMQDAEDGTADENYSFTVAGSADEITPKLIQGEFDIAAVPANLASVLYNKTEGEIQLLAINTLGVLYVVEKGDSIKTVADLKGKTIYATGKGSSPEYGLRYILTKNGLDPDKDVTIEWKSEPTEVVALLASGENGIAMLPQPYVTVAQGSVEGLRVALDLNAEWDAVGSGSMFITGVLVVRKSFASEHPEAISAFLAEYSESIGYVNKNVAEASLLVEKYGIVKAAVAEKAIPYCNITYIAGKDMKEPINGYLGVLYEQNAASVGGKLPQDDFFFIAD